MLGCMLGLAFAATRKTLSEADATLFFPPALVLNEPAAGGSQEQSESPVPKMDYTGWAKELLMSKEAVDMLCKRIERSDADDKPMAIRSACLLPEDGRLAVESLPDSCIRLKVRAESSKLAVTLSEGLLAFLSYKAKIPLEDPDADSLTEVESQLRTQEKSLSSSLWGLLSFEAARNRDSNALQAVTIDLQDYQLSVTNYRRAMRKHFFREAKIASGGPGFTVLEAPSGSPQGRPWIQGLLVGGGIGWLSGVVMTLLRPKRRDLRSAPWRVQGAMNS